MDWLHDHVTIVYVKPNALELWLALVGLAFAVSVIWWEKRRSKRRI
jgi:hypothetical protein